MSTKCIGNAELGEWRKYLYFTSHKTSSYNVYWRRPIYVNTNSLRCASGNIVKIHTRIHRFFFSDKNILHFSIDKIVGINILDQRRYIFSVRCVYIPVAHSLDSLDLKSRCSRLAFDSDLKTTYIYINIIRNGNEEWRTTTEKMDKANPNEFGSNNSIKL